MLHNSHISIWWLQNDQALDTLRYFLLTWQYSIGFIQLDKVFGCLQKGRNFSKRFAGKCCICCWACNGPYSPIYVPGALGRSTKIQTQLGQYFLFLFSFLWIIFLFLMTNIWFFFFKGLSLGIMNKILKIKSDRVGLKKKKKMASNFVAKSKFH